MRVSGGSDGSFGMSAAVNRRSWRELVGEVPGCWLSAEANATAGRTAARMAERNMAE